MKRIFGIVLPATALAASFCLPAPAKEYTLKGSPETIQIGHFDATIPPVLTVNSGDIVTVQTATQVKPEEFDAAGVLPPSAMPQYVRDVFREAKDRGPGPHLLTGPIAINGAEPGDVLEVRILSIDLGTDYGYNVQRPYAGLLKEDFPASWLRVLPIDRKARTSEVIPGVVVPLHPFMGTMGVAPPPEMGKVSSGPPGIYAGNMDNRQLGAGATLYIPVHVKGALFSTGDGHANQGDGEIDVAAIETNLDPKFQFIVRKDMKLTLPMAETKTHWIVMAFAPTLDEAMKSVARETIAFITQRYPKITREEAYMISSVAVDFHITQVVDNPVGIHAMIPKAIFTGK
jgi:acetamidase/formamidase